MKSTFSFLTKYSRLKVYCLFFILLIVSLEQVALAQTPVEIHGFVKDKDGRPLSEVSIRSVSSVVQSQTDRDGYFSMPVIVPDTIILSLLGYAERVIPVYDSSDDAIRIVLEHVSENIKEVVVNTGYYQLPLERATGSFVHIDQDLFNRTVSPGIVERIQNVAPGFIQHPNGRIRIRGQSTIHSDADPLVIVDNFPFEDDINSLNPNDVESITILKDAAAASIWGAKAGNGVIVITTKNARYAQAPQVSFNANFSVGQRPDLFYSPQLKLEDYINKERKLFSEGYYSSAEINADRAPLSPVVEALIAHRDGIYSDDMLETFILQQSQNDLRTDMNKYLRRNSFHQQYSLGIMGGGTWNRYTLSVGYDKGLSNVVGNENNRFTVNARQQLQLLDGRLNLQFGAFISDAHQESNGISSLRYSPTNISFHPYGKLVDEDGHALPVIWDYNQRFKAQTESDGVLDWEFRPVDEIRLRDNRNRTVHQRLNAAIGLAIFKGLDINFLYQYAHNNYRIDNHNSQETYFARDLINRYTQIYPDGSRDYHVPLGGILDFDSRVAHSHDGRIQLNFNQDWNLFSLNGVAGTEMRMRNSQNLATRYYGYDDDLAISQKVNYLVPYTLYYNDRRRASIPSGERVTILADRFVSYYTNIGFSYDRRLSFTASIRKDMSNLFGVNANQKGVPLYSVGAAWNLHNESFWSGRFMSHAKVRVTYGFNGNLDKSVAALTTARYLPASGLFPLYAVIQTPPNPDLRWERVEIINLALDYGLLNQRITGTIDLYQKNGYDLIGDSPLPSSTGITRFRGNTASTAGKGVDISITSRNLRGKLNWQSDFLFTYVKDEVKNYDQPVTSFISMITSGSSLFPVNGKPQHAMYSLPWVGLDPQSGDPQGLIDGKVSKDYVALLNPSSLDQLRYHGPRYAPMFGAFRNSFNYGDFTASFSLSYRFGYYFRRGSVYYGADYGLQSNHADYYQRWQQPGDELRTYIPSMPDSPNARRDQFYMYSEALVERSDHIRFDDLRLSYKIQSKDTRVKSSIDLFVFIKNLGRVWEANSTGIEPEFGNIPQVLQSSFGFRFTY